MSYNDSKSPQIRKPRQGVLYGAEDQEAGGVARHELAAAGPPDPFFYPGGLARLADLAVRLDITRVF